MVRRIVVAVADKWIFISLVILIIALPFSRAVVEICIGAIMLGWVIYRLSDKQKKHLYSDLKVKESVFKKFWVECGGMGLPLIAFLFACLLSLSNSRYLYPQSLRGMVKVIKYILFCLVVTDSVNTRKRFNNLLILILTVATLIGLNGLIQYFTGTDLIRHYSFLDGRRITSSFNNPNGFGGYLCLLIPIPVCLTFFYRSKKLIKQFLISVAVCILSIAMILTHSKGAWLGLVIALFLMFLCQVKNRNWKFLLLSGVVTLLIILSMFPEIRFWLRNSLDQSVLIRLNIWRAAINMVQAHPALGNGINTFHAEYPFYRLDSVSGSTYAHNCYLQMAVEIGLVGLTVFIWLIISLFGLILKGLKFIQNEFHRIVLVGLSASMLAFLMHCIVDTDLYSLPLVTFFWMDIGLIISLLKINKVID